MSKKQLREFGFLIGLGLPIFIGLIIPLIVGHTLKGWTLWIALPFLVLGILKPQLLFYPYKLWIFIGNILGWINSRLILGLIYILILQPIALIMKIIGHDPLKLKRVNELSYREIIKNKKIDLKKIF